MADHPAAHDSPDLPLGRAASDIAFVERAALAPPGGSVTPGDGLWRVDGGHWFSRMEITGSVRTYRVRNVTLDADTLVLLQDGRRIPETRYFVSDEDYAAASLRQESVVEPATDETAVIGFNRAYGAYDHWMLQCLPAIDWAVRLGDGERQRLVLPELQPWQEQTLALLGLDKMPRLTPESGLRYRLPTAEYSQFLNGETSFSVCRSVVETGRRLRDAVPQRPNPCRAIYIAAGPTHYGQLVNEAALIELLQHQGVHVIDPRILDLATRINLLRNAEVVIGPHGRGLADAIFCQPGVLLWELLPEHALNPVYCRLAQSAELDYWGDAFACTDKQAGAWQVDLAMVEARLQPALQRLASTEKALRTSEGVARFTGSSPAAMALDDVLLRFQNLGDNCEFGLVQRHARLEPLGLLRFAGFYLQVELRLERLVSALREGFSRLGQAGHVYLQRSDAFGGEEFVVYDMSYRMFYHSVLPEGAANTDAVLRREVKRLQMLRGKLLQDLAHGRYIWVWKSATTNSLEQIVPLRDALSARGPNTLLWVVEADQAHPPGSVERVDRRILKGYIERFAPYDEATDIAPRSWLQVCQGAYELVLLREADLGS